MIKIISLCPTGSLRTPWSLFGSSYTNLQAKTEISKPVLRTVKLWTNETEWVLQASFELTDWTDLEAVANTWMSSQGL